MNFIGILLIGVALSMDAFSVSICKGLSTKRFSLKVAVACGLWFGSFQALMPVIGYALGIQFQHFIETIDHWVAFGLLFLIGANMVREALLKNKSNENEEVTDAINFKTMFLLAVATSIDALAIGVGFAFMEVAIWTAVTIIGITTFIFSLGGVAIGSFFGSRYGKPAEIVGGLILIGLGIKILIEHLC